MISFQAMEWPPIVSIIPLALLPLALSLYQAQTLKYYFLVAQKRKANIGERESARFQNITFVL